MTDRTGTIPRDALLLYHRQGERLHLKFEHMTNHEMRELMVGLWARLGTEDRAEHIAELTHYNSLGGSFLSDVAGSIARGVAGENAINLADVARFYGRDLLAD